MEVLRSVVKGPGNERRLGTMRDEPMTGLLMLVLLMLILMLMLMLILMLILVLVLVMLVPLRARSIYIQLSY